MARSRKHQAPGFREAIGTNAAAGERGPLLFHPAGPFFALSAAAAAALPWLWMLQLETPAQAHVRLGIFGFGGLAVLGYLLLAQRSWTGRAAPLPALVLAALALAARIAAAIEPAVVWPVSLPLLVVAASLLVPVLRARRWDKLPLCLVPFTLVAAEAALVREQIPAAALPTAMATLILAVGGRIVPAFLHEELRRRGVSVRPATPTWPGLALFGLGLALDGTPGLVALLLTALWVLGRVRGFTGASPANRMLCLSYAMLAPGVLAIAALRLGLCPYPVQIHLLTMGTMGSMIAAVAARVSMRRTAAGLVPRARHRAVLWLILAATVLRCLTETVSAQDVLLTAAGVAWTAAWLLFLSVQLAALRRPTPFPLLSGRRAGPARG